MRNFLALFVLAAIAVASSAWAEGEKEDSYSVSYARQSAPRYDGATYAASAETSLSQDLRLGVSAFHLSRTYGQAVTVSDSSFALSAAQPLAAGRYYESRVEVSPDAEILAKSIFNFVPHQTFGSTDVGLGLEYRTYQTSVAGSLHPTVRHDFSERFSVAAGSFLVRTGETLIANHGDISFKPADRHVVRASVAGGQSLEDAGVSAKFSSVFLGYGYSLGRFIVAVEAVKYWSDLRTETSTGLRIEFR